MLYIFAVRKKTPFKIKQCGRNRKCTGRYYPLIENPCYFIRNNQRCPKRLYVLVNFFIAIFTVVCENLNLSPELFFFFFFCGE